MAKGVGQNKLGAALEQIQTQLMELRQTEALEAQLHEMVVGKRHRLDVLMGEFLAIAAQEPVVPVAAVTPPRVAPVVAPPVEEPPEPMPLTTLPTGGAPKDLLQTNSTTLANQPSAQQVLDSLNRLMSGLKEISAKQQA